DRASRRGRTWSGVGSGGPGHEDGYSHGASFLVLLFYLGVIERLEPDIDARLDVAHRPIGLELLVFPRQGLQFGVEEVVQQGLGGTGFVLLILQVDSLGLVVLG